MPKLGEDNEWKDVQKKDRNKRPSETRNRRKTRKKIINKTSYFLFTSLNKSLNQKWKLMISPKKRRRKIRSKFYEMWIPNQQLKLKKRVKKEKTFRIKTNNQELLIRKQNESDATSWWIKFQKTNLQWKAYRIQDWFTRDFQSYSRLVFQSTGYITSKRIQISKTSDQENSIFCPFTSSSSPNSF